MVPLGYIDLSLIPIHAFKKKLKLFQVKFIEHKRAGQRRFGLLVIIRTRRTDMI